MITIGGLAVTLALSIKENSLSDNYPCIFLFLRAKFDV